MKKVVLFADAKKERVSKALDEIESWLSERAEVCIDTDLKAGCSGERPDLVVVLGGDGTMLLAARKFAPTEAPLFGVNLGKFGFLTESTAENAHSALEDALDGRYEMQERMMLQCILQRDGDVLQQSCGVNDAVISRTSLSRLLTIDFFVNGEHVNTYRADGLIVATPVGSTAHSLSAGGPILMPELEAFVIAPICPHALSNRPLVLPAGNALEMRPRDYAENPALTVDGQIYSTLSEGDSIRIERSARRFRLAQTGERTFFETLRNKLGWSGQPRYVR
ncbi:MAG: NAD(+)/NADH kinase [Planctomycetes bacterium]|nr:NAD(+)/NADH kinase [Planctomycetota bacterium]